MSAKKKQKVSSEQVVSEQAPAAAAAEFTSLPELRTMLADLRAAPQHTIPLEARKHII